MDRSTHEASPRDRRRENRSRSIPRSQSGSAEQESIRGWLKQVRFQRALFGGVQEPDVWKKIAELNTMYEAALTAERMRYDTLLKEQVSILAQQMANEMVNQRYQRPAGWENGGNGQYK